MPGSTIPSAPPRGDREHSVYDRIGAKERDEHRKRDAGEHQSREAREDCEDPAQCECPPVSCQHRDPGLASPHNTRTVTYLAGQECSGLFQELAEGRLGLEKQMVAALESHEARARDAGGHATAGIKGDTRVVARVHHEGRHADPRQQRGDIGVAGHLGDLGGPVAVASARDGLTEQLADAMLAEWSRTSARAVGNVLRTTRPPGQRRAGGSAETAAPVARR
jgi:hypothetical protein